MNWRLILILAVLLILVGGTISFVGNPTPADSPTTATSSSSSTSRATRKNHLVWSSSGTNLRSGQISPVSKTTQTITVGPTENLRIELELDNPGTQAKLLDPRGQELKPGPESTADRLIYKPQQVTGGDWQLEIKNPNPTASVNYTISVPEAAPPLIVSPTVSPTATGQNIEISIIVQETILSITTPISGAQVTANITDPTGQVTTIVLQESDPVDHPGVYSGNLTGDLPGGTYQIEYVIDGENTAGNPFVQTTTGGFFISPTNTPNQSYSKKYDINQAGEVQIIGY